MNDLKQETSSGGVLRRGTQDTKEKHTTLELKSASVVRIVARVPRSERAERRILPKLGLDSAWTDERFTSLVIEGEVEAKLEDGFAQFGNGDDTLVLLYDPASEAPAAKLYIETAPKAAPVELEVLRLDSSDGSLAPDRCPTLEMEDSQSAVLFADQRGLFVIRIFANQERTHCGWLRVAVVEAKLIADRSCIDGQKLTASFQSPFSNQQSEPPEALFVQSGLKGSAAAQFAYDVDLYDDDSDCFCFGKVGLGVLSNIADYEAYGVYEDGSLLDVIFVDEQRNDVKSVAPDQEFPRVAFPILDTGRNPKKVAGFGGEWVTLTTSCREDRQQQSLSTSQGSDEGVEYTWNDTPLHDSNESVGSAQSEEKKEKPPARPFSCTVLASDGPGVPFPLLSLEGNKARLIKCYARMQFTNALLVWTDSGGKSDEEPKSGRRAGAGHYRVLATFSWALEGCWSVSYPEEGTKGAKIVPLPFAPKAPFLIANSQAPIAAQLSCKSFTAPRDCISQGLELRPPASHQVLANQIRHQDLRAMAEPKDSSSLDPAVELVAIDLGGLPATRNGRIITAPHACGQPARDDWSLADYGYQAMGGDYSPRPGVHLVGKGGDVRIVVNLKNMPKSGGKATLRCLFDGIEISGPLALQDGEQKVNAQIVNVPGALAWHAGKCKWAIEGGPDKCVLPPPALLELFFVFDLAPKLLGQGVPVELLRFLFLRARVNGIATDSKLAAALTDYCLHGHGKHYDAALGNSCFGVSETGGTFALSRYLAADEHKVNCYDQTAALQCFAGAFGIKLGWFYLDPVGAVKPSCFVGQKQPTNNPYFETAEKGICRERICERKSAKQCGKNSCTRIRSAVLCHAFVGLGDVRKGGLVFDACVEGHLGQLLGDYLDSAIDSTQELYQTTPDYDCGVEHPGSPKDVYGEGDEFEFAEGKEPVTGVTGVS